MSDSAVCKSPPFYARGIVISCEKEKGVRPEGSVFLLKVRVPRSAAARCQSVPPSISYAGNLSAVLQETASDRSAVLNENSRSDQFDMPQEAVIADSTVCGRSSPSARSGMPLPGQFYMLRAERSGVLLGRPVSVFHAEARTDEIEVQFLILVKGRRNR